MCASVFRACVHFFFFNDTATTEIYTLSLHDALPISISTGSPASRPASDAPTVGGARGAARRRDLGVRRSCRCAAASEPKTGRADAARPRSPERCRPRAGPELPHADAAHRAAPDAGDAARPRLADADRGASQGGEVTMRARWLSGLLVLLVLLAAGIPEVAWGQTTPMEGLEKLSPEERAIAERNLERWRSLSPEERERVTKNYERWKNMSPEERAHKRKEHEAHERWRRMPPEERERLREQWKNATPEERERLRQQYRSQRPPRGQEPPR